MRTLGWVVMIVCAVCTVVNAVLAVSEATPTKRVANALALLINAPTTFYIWWTLR